MKTVLIHAYECAPYHRPGSTIGAQRPYQFAKHLPKFGWRAIVLCCDFARRYSLNPSEDWRALVREEVLNALDSWEGGQSLTIPLPSLQYADWVDRMWLRTVHMDESKGTFAARPGRGAAILRKAATLLKLFRGDHSQSWQAVALYASEVLIERGVRIEVQIAEHGPDAGLFVGSQLYRQYGWPYWIDCRDPILQPIVRLLESPYRVFLKQKIRSGCRGLINVNPVWVEMDRFHFGLPTHLVTNGFDEEEFQFPSHGMNDAFTAAYLGNISFPTDLEVFFAGLKDFRDNQIPEKFTFYYRGNSFATIQEWAKKYGLDGLVDSASAISRQEAIQVMQAANLLLLFSTDPATEKDPFLQKGYYPGKVFEYFAAGKPILLIPGDQGVLSKLIQDTKSGQISATAEAVAGALERYYESWLKESEEDMALIDRQKVKQYSRENQAAILADILTKSIETNTPNVRHRIHPHP